MVDWLKVNKIYFFIGVVIIVALGVYYFLPFENDLSGKENEWIETETISSPKETEEESIVVSGEQQEKVLIDLKGAVKSPGVYEANSEERVIDIINKAGGLLETADKNNINFALKVVDEMVLYIPEVGEQNEEVTGGTVGLSQTMSVDEGKVNLNKATKAGLETLSGIGPSKADAIIDYRETKGPFKTIEDLMEISGFGQKTFEKLKEDITVK
ncbi:helix-hairpin-helix domain-containing protein [Bacillus sp. V3B]|uniref:helix-hairpin-helix domain-containing protein n=1 Tax=Bacillus sp. V3B TaxID=2804915 RepID=UPI002109CF1C|nr:helix-hairpin-helix domain-containing protein [Bacillus sp. V3B]MCQ6273612.1 helix-hairpin-helix domain-containing protein [Bacillus sp. V3B]